MHIYILTLSIQPKSVLSRFTPSKGDENAAPNTSSNITASNAVNLKPSLPKIAAPIPKGITEKLLSDTPATKNGFVSNRKQKFDLKTSLARPVTWEMKSGPLRISEKMQEKQYVVGQSHYKKVNVVPSDAKSKELVSQHRVQRQDKFDKRRT